MSTSRRPAARLLSVVAAVVVLLPLAGHADEGFWLFNRVPRAAIKKAYGVDLSDAWIERVQQASVPEYRASGHADRAATPSPRWRAS